MYNPQTTDNQEEVYDVVNELDEVIGKATRKEVHTNPKLIHRSAGGYIFNFQKQLLMQKRSQTKDTYPGYWVFSVGGHVDTGDTYEATIKREVEEELGITLPMTFLDKSIQKDVAETEYWSQYIGVYPGPFPSFNRTEIAELRFFSFDELIAGSLNGSLPMPPNVIALLPTVKKLLESGKIDTLIQTTL